MGLPRARREIPRESPLLSLLLKTAVPDLLRSAPLLFQPPSLGVCPALGLTLQGKTKKAVRRTQSSKKASGGLWRLRSKFYSLTKCRAASEPCCWEPGPSAHHLAHPTASTYTLLKLSLLRFFVRSWRKSPSFLLLKSFPKYEQPCWHKGDARMVRVRTDRCTLGRNEYSKPLPSVLVQRDFCS